MNRATRVAVWLCASAALLAGCASEVRREPVELAAAAGEQGRRFSNGGDVEAMPESRYARRARRRHRHGAPALHACRQPVGAR